MSIGRSRYQPLLVLERLDPQWLSWSHREVALQWQPSDSFSFTCRKPHLYQDAPTQPDRSLFSPLLLPCSSCLTHRANFTGYVLVTTMPGIRNGRLYSELLIDGLRSKLRSPSKRCSNLLPKRQTLHTGSRHDIPLQSSRLSTSFQYRYSGPCPIL
ncbi:uncharacterized protein EI90DRAFT_584738 [Cantharellus anzutake]|uniref:uncharacterized protein n=1 Tax=Cantharellus anzutake TaxID=1750568 RepID=UPI0019043999|nr:uncharacterized protein EI90DRAFT_584738 [Cantharellus anzutake]KAF8333591.1 hypothetical protein EI90DRAFT_584738 [Cantharellus anzutake]